MRNFVCRLFVPFLPCAVLAALALFVTGCETARVATNPSGGDVVADPVDSEVLRVGDLLKITFKGPANLQFAEHQERIPESGQITLQYIGKVDAVGKTRVQLQDDIRAKYVPSVFKELSVTIAPGERFFYVSGEVNDQNRHPYLGRLTVSEAINAAKGFTDFANRRKVELTRADGTVLIVDCIRAQSDPIVYDLWVLPGDRIRVPRRLL